jgi:hypothetical protein
MSTYLLKATTAHGVELVRDGYNDRTQFLQPHDFRDSIRSLKDDEAIWTEVDEETYSSIHDEYGITI